MKMLIYYSVILPTFFLISGCALFADKTHTDSKTVFAAFDTETTGINSATERIIEIAAVKFTLDGLIDQKSWLVNPEISIPKQATQIHGISDAMVANAPPFKDVFNEFKTFTSDTILVAHNAKFDARFIIKETSLCNMAPPENTLIDSLTLFRSWFPDSKSHSLGNLSRDLNVNTEHLHRALADSECIRQIIILAIKDSKRKAELTTILESDHQAVIEFTPGKKQIKAKK